MLKHLHIRDFAVIEEIEIEFTTGMTVFTGETGAGKSIIVDALGLVLGDRAESSIIRSNCERTEITSIFSINNNTSIPEILEEQGIDFDDELMLRRVINRDGRSRAYVNGSPVPAQLLRELGENLVDIHGQHAHQSLFKRDVQRNLLDEYGQHNSELGQVRQYYFEWKAAAAELEQLSGNNQDHDDRHSLLQYQVQELEALNPETSEIAALEEEHKRLANASRIQEVCQQSIDQLSDNDQSLQNQINYYVNNIRDLLRFDLGLSSIVDMLDSASIQINEAGSELRHYLDTLDLDPSRFGEVEERITSLHDIARKHKVRPDELSGHLEILREELKQLEDSEQRVAELQGIRDRALVNYQETSTRLHTIRLETAKKLGTAIENQIRELGMPGGRFAIEVNPLEKDTPQRDGMDRIEYQVSINPGQDMHPLNKVASGGELSRISLAIQVIACNDKGLPTLIFDEVDAGIGGGVAEIVGKLLQSLSGHSQIFCVTHLPQVASLGNNHFLVNKSTLAETTLTQVINLNEVDRVEEIARMLGGLKITDQSRAHAREMLKTTSS